MFTLNLEKTNNILSIVAASITIIGAIIGFVVYRKIKIKNKLRNVRIQKDYLGGDIHESTKSSIHIANDLKNSEIGGDFIGGKKK